MGKSGFRDTIDDCKILDVAWLRQHGYFCGYKSGGITWTHGWSGRKSSIGFVVETNHKSGNGNIRFIYTQTSHDDGKKEDLEYTLPLTTTQCHFGGLRWWFRCGLYKGGKYCGRRVGSLYLSPDAKYFGCRHCHDLTYRSKNVNRRSSCWWIFRPVDLLDKAQELDHKLRKRYHRGRPTKKYARVIRLQRMGGLSMDTPAYKKATKLIKYAYESSHMGTSVNARTG